MKRIFLLIILFTAIHVQAQHKAVQFGFGGGVNAGWFATGVEQYSNNGIHFGGSWGFVTDVFLMEGLSFTTGFNVVYLNGSMSMPYLSDSMPGEVERDFKTKYLEVPLILTMKTKKIKDKVRIYGQVGFGLGFLLSAKAKDSFTTEEGIHSSGTKNIYDELALTRESLILGAGVEIPVYGSSYIRTGFRFDNGFVNILKGNNRRYPEIKNNGRNNYIEFSAAFIF